MNTKELSLKKRILSALPAICMMVVIFIFSSKNADESNATSSPIAEFLLKIYESVFGISSTSSREDMLSFFSHIIRKAAHMCEYALLSILLSIHFYTIKFRKRNLFLFSVITCAIYAATDEFHQLFVDGRSGQLSDVGIDTAGSILGSICFILLLNILGENKKTII